MHTFYCTFRFFENLISISLEINKYTVVNIYVPCTVQSFTEPAGFRLVRTVLCTVATSCGADDPFTYGKCGFATIKNSELEKSTVLDRLNHVRALSAVLLIVS